MVIRESLVTMWRNSYLAQVYSKSVLVFWLFILFIVGQTFFTYKGVDTFPFINYGMYSGPYPKNYNLPNTMLYINDKRVSTFNMPKPAKELILITSRHYFEYWEKGDPVENVLSKRFIDILPETIYSILHSRLINDYKKLRMYPEWARKYFEKATGEKVNKMTIMRCNYYFDYRARFRQKECEDWQVL